MINKSSLRQSFLYFFFSQQPEYLNIPDWFSEKGNFSDETLKDLTGMGGGFDPRSAFNSNKDDKLREDIAMAATEIIEDQLNHKLDVITDGEVERGELYHFL